MVKDIFDQQNNSDQICLLMPSGSIWSKESGFKTINHDYSHIKTHINEATKKK